MTTPVLAQGGGEADCPEGTVFIDNFLQGEIEVGDVLIEGVVVTAVDRGETGNGELESVTIKNNTTGNITIAVKGGNNQVGNFVTLAPGDEETIVVLDNPTISNLSVCLGPEDEEEETLTLDKVAMNGDDEFTFTLGGTELEDTLSGADPAVLLASEAGEYVIAEALTEAQIAAGWSLTSIECEGNATAEIVDLDAGTVTVTVAAGEDVTCTFTDTLTVDEETPTLTLDKVAVNSDDEFSFTLGGAALGATLSGADPAVLLASEAGEYTIVEALTAEQVEAGWSLTSINCEGNATAEVFNLATGTVTVTVGADEDVTCTFTNEFEGDGTQGGNPPSGGGDGEGTLGGNPVPDTAMDLGTTGTQTSALLALIALSALGAAGFAARAEVRRRR